MLVQMREDPKVDCADHLRCELQAQVCARPDRELKFTMPPLLCDFGGSEPRCSLVLGTSSIGAATSPSGCSKGPSGCRQENILSCDVRPKLLLSQKAETDIVTGILI